MLLPIEQLLKAYQEDGKAFFPLVGSAFSVALAMKDGLSKPRQAYVVPLPSTYQPGTKDLGPLLQTGQFEFGVVVGAKLIDDPRGEKGNKVMDELSQSVIAALMGKHPAEYAERIELSRIDPIGIKENAIWILYRFKTMVRVHQGA